MFFDQKAMFFDNVTVAPAAAKTVVKTGGSDYARTFIAATIPAGVTALRLTVTTSNVLKDAEGTGVLGTDDLHDGKVVAIKDATEQEIAAGLMALPMPLEIGKFTKVTPVIEGAPTKAGAGISCGITDAVSNGVLSDFGIPADKLAKI